MSLHYKNHRLLIVGFMMLIILLPAAIYLARHPLGAKADTLIGFNEGTGTAVKDSGNAVTGTITNASWKAEDLCYRGTCLFFDGTGDYVSFGDDSTYDFVAATNFTIEFWFRTPDITSGTRVLVSKYRGNDAEGGYKVYMDSNGKVVFGVDDDNSWGPDDSATSLNAYDDNLWHHVVAVKTGTTSLTLYLDAQRVGQDTSLAATGTLVNNDPFTLGMDADLSSNPYTGFLDELKVYTTTARSEAQVNTDYVGATSDNGTSASFGPNQSTLSNGLVGYWKLDESSGDANDNSGNGLTLTNNGTTTYAGGKYGNGSEHVPASSQYLSTTTDIPGVKTISFWTNPDSTTNYYLELLTGTHINSSSGTVTAPNFANAKIYVNGIASTTIAADTWQMVTVTTETPITATDVAIGKNGSSYYDGTLDEVRIYNRALTPDEIRQLGDWSPDPVAYLPIDEGSGITTVADHSSNGNSFTMTNLAASAWTIGKFGKALTFDGTNDYLIRSYDADFNFNTGTFTIDGWFKKPVSGSNLGKSGDSYGIINYGGFEGGNENPSDGTGGIDSSSYEREPNSGSLVNLTIQNIRKRSGEYAMRFYDSTTSWIGEWMIITKADRNSFGVNEGDGIWFTFYMYPTAQVAFNKQFTDIEDNVGSVCYMTWLSNSWNIIGGGNTNSSTAALTPNQWNKVELHCKTDGSNAISTLSINDGTAVTFESYEHGSNSFSFIRFGPSDDLVGADVYFDDWVVSTAELSFDPKVVRMDVTGNGASTAWTNDYQSVDDIPHDTDSTYISSSTVSDKELYSLETAASAGVVGNIYGVKTQALARDEGGSSNLATVVRVGGTDYDEGEDADPGSTYNSIGSVLTSNPALTTAWSNADLDTLQIGVLNNASVATRVTAMSAMVLIDGNNTPKPQYLVSRYDADQGFKVWFTKDHNLNFGIDDDSTWGPDDVASTSAAYNDNQWHHFTAVKDTGGIYLYVDGTKAAADETLAATGTLSSDSAPFTFASDEPNNGYFFNGTLDDIRIYNYARSPAQLVSDMNAGHPAPGSPIGSAVLHYNFNEGYGGRAHNLGSIGSALDGNLGNSISWGCPGEAACPTWSNNGIQGKGLSFDGDDRLDSPYHAVLDSSSHTISAWFKRTGAVNGSDGAGVAGRWQSEGGSFIWINPSNHILFPVNGSPHLDSGITAELNTWYHVVSTFDGTTATIYVNGIKRGSQADTYTSTSNLVTFQVGIYANAGSTYFTGLIDEVKYYNFALTADQVKAEYNQGQAAVWGSTSTASNGKTPDNSAARTYCIPGDTSTCNPPVGHWKLDENNGQSVVDSTGNNLSGTLGTNSSVATNDPSWVTGKKGSALRFDGNDYVNGSNDSSLNITGSVTVEAWAKRATEVSSSYAIVSKGTLGGSTGDIKYGLFFGSAGEHSFRVSKDGNSFGVINAYGNADQAWHHIAGIYTAVADGTSLLNLYVDGKKAADQVTNAPYPLFSNSTNLTIGSAAGSVWNWIGDIDDVKIYNYARTPAQIAWDYNRGGPIAQYDFDECTGIVLHNTVSQADSRVTPPYSGSLNLTGNNAGTCTSVTTTDSWYVGKTGKYGAALGLDGNDTATIADTTTLRFNQETQDFSFFTWVKRDAVGTIDTLISKEDADNDGYRLLINADNTVTCSEDATDITSTQTLDTAWHQVGCVIDRDGVSTLYIDGAPAAKTVLATDAMATTANITLGSRSYTPADTYLAGLLDEVRLYNYALTSEQVKLLYNANSAIQFGQ